MKFNLFKRRKDKRKEHMRVRIFSSMLAFTVIVLALLWVFQIAFLDEIYKNVKISNVHSVAEALSPNIDSENIKELVNNYAVKYDTCITVWDKNCNRIASSCVNSLCRVHTYNIVGAAMFYRMAEVNDGVYIEYYGNGRPRSDFWKNSDDFWGDDRFDPVDGENESMMYAEIVKVDDDTEYLILMNAVVTPIKSVVQSLKTVFLFIAIIMIALAFIISAVISSYVLKPIDKINASAKLFADGDYNVRFDENSYSEIAQLASTLNYAATELSTVEATRRELIANVSHDLRTPLTLIGGYAEMMKDFPNDDNGENLQTIIDEVNHMTLLVNDMTDVSKYNAGVYKLNLTQFDLTALVRDTALRLSKLNDPDGYSVDFEYDCSVSVVADELKITQVLYNLINNAVIHTGEGKKVFVSQIITERGKEKFAEIRITDTGKGISRDNVKSIWDRYYKMDRTYKRAHNGSGLGLSIVSSILKLHHMEYGVIPVEEMPENKGCTFWFRVKIVEKTVESVNNNSKDC